MLSFSSYNYFKIAVLPKIGIINYFIVLLYLPYINEVDLTL